MTTMDQEEIMLYRAPDSTEAALLVNELNERGIPAHPAGGTLTITYGELGLEALQVEIWVPAERASEARRVIEAWYDARGSAGKTWTCGSCGETNESSFEVCWNCMWVCSSCGEGNSTSFEVCWKCRRPKAVARDAT